MEFVLFFFKGELGSVSEERLSTHSTLSLLAFSLDFSEYFSGNFFRDIGVLNIEGRSDLKRSFLNLLITTGDMTILLGLFIDAIALKQMSGFDRFLVFLSNFDFPNVLKLCLNFFSTFTISSALSCLFHGKLTFTSQSVIQSDNKLRSPSVKNSFKL
eukprot:NODE_64_length_26047_cov_1.706837.p14 type:complete len:157 gc:universal NODE_64_length_26047_cov_1.706837:11572-12042(+)